MKNAQTLLGLLLLTTFVGCNDTGSRHQQKVTKTDPGLDPETSTARSNLHRVKGSVVLTYAEEITRTFANDLPEVSYRRIPDMELDDEGSDGANITTRTSLGRPKVVCGAVGTFTGVTARIADCAAKNADKAIWEGFRYGASGEGTWQLVSRFDSGKEIWMDTRTGMVWSDTIVTGDGAKEFNWCKAAGNSQNDTPTSTVDCGELSQGESVCVNLVMDEVGTQIEWRLPTRNDFLQADLDGARFVLKKETINGLWTATMKSGVAGRNMAWIYNSFDGSLTSGELSTTREVKCIGAPKL